MLASSGCTYTRGELGRVRVWQRSPRGNDSPGGGYIKIPGNFLIFLAQLNINNEISHRSNLCPPPPACTQHRRGTRRYTRAATSPCHRATPCIDITRVSLPRCLFVFHVRVRVPRGFTDSARTLTCFASDHHAPPEGNCAET